MRKLALLVMVVFVMGALSPVLGKTPYLTEEELQTEARQGFEQILDLWHDGKYAELYDRTLWNGKETRERFIARMADAPLKPACCWEKMQDVSVSVMGESAVTVRAKIGLEGGGGTEYKTRSFKLAKEGGIWRISQADILKLAEAKKKARHKKKRKRTHSYPRQ
jgi:hypothetical protein